MKIRTTIAAALLTMTATAVAQTSNQTKMTDEKLNLTQEWDKTFPKSDKVNHVKVTFHNRYGVTLAADLYTPKDANGQLAAIAVSGPFGAVKEQASGLYAQTLAERGFITLAFDPSFHRRERRHAALRGLARHQHRGLFSCRRLPFYAP